MKKIYTHYTLICATILTACTQSAPNTINTSGMTAIDLIVTDAAQTEVSPAQIAFAPDSSANWLGQIIVLDHDGRLHVTNLDLTPLKAIDTSQAYADIVGISNSPSLWLAKTETGILESYQLSLSGEYTQNIINSDLQIEQFCGPAWTDTGWYIADDTLYSVEITIQDGMPLTLQQQDSWPLPKNVEACVANDDGEVFLFTPSDMFKASGTEITPVNSQVYTHLPDAAHTQSNAGNGKRLTRLNLNIGDPSSFILQTDDTAYLASIVPGLSISGLSSIDFIAATSSDYGSVYADGLIMAYSQKDKRVALLSNSYVTNALESE